MKYTQSAKVATQGIGSDLKNGISRRNQGLAGRINYNWKYRYFVDFNFGYTGSEKISIKIIVLVSFLLFLVHGMAEESIVKDNLKWVNMFKIRYSYGKTGNDNLGDTRFHIYIILKLCGRETILEMW